MMKPVPAAAIACHSPSVAISLAVTRGEAPTKPRHPRARLSIEMDRLLAAMREAGVDLTAPVTPPVEHYRLGRRPVRGGGRGARGCLAARTRRRRTRYRDPYPTGRASALDAPAEPPPTRAAVAPPAADLRIWLSVASVQAPLDAHDGHHRPEREQAVLLRHEVIREPEQLQPEVALPGVAPAVR